MYQIGRERTITDRFELELSKLKPEDGINGSEIVKGYQFISTYGHGYLVVPRTSAHYAKAKKISKSYGYTGKLAVYLEEDCQAGEFLKQIEYN